MYSSPAAADSVNKHVFLFGFLYIVANHPNVSHPNDESAGENAQGIEPR